MATVAYTRVSTKDQTTQRQHFEIEQAGFTPDKWYDEQMSGGKKAAERPQWAALMDYVREGDIVVVSSADRMTRNGVRDLLDIIDAMQAKKVTLRVLKEGWTFDGNGMDPMTKMTVTIVAAVAELERNMIAERRTAGIQAKIAREGRSGGRPNALSREQLQAWRAANPDGKQTEAKDHFGVSLSTIQRNWK